MEKEKTMIELYKDDHKDLLMFKVQSNAKNMPEVMRLVIKKLKEIKK